MASLIAAIPPYALAQQPAPAQNRPGTLDFAAIRRDAAKLAEIRGILTDPDPNVRLLALREIMRAGDPVQRQIAVEAGLTSADVSMVELALRSVMANAQQIVISLADMQGNPITKTNEMTSLILPITSFDVDTGKFSGEGFSGQLQGNMFSFATTRLRSGKLMWDAEAAEFRGTVNLYNLTAENDRKASWRPR